MNGATRPRVVDGTQGNDLTGELGVASRRAAELRADLATARGSGGGSRHGACLRPGRRPRGGGAPARHRPAARRSDAVRPSRQRFCRDSSTGRLAQRVSRSTQSSACSRGDVRAHGRRWRRRADGVARRRFGRSPRGTPREHPGRARPASVLPRGGCVVPLARLGVSSPLPRTARQRQGAHSARFSSRPAGQSGGATASPPCAPARAVFRRSFVWTTGCREIGCPAVPSTGAIGGVNPRRVGGKCRGPRGVRGAGRAPQGSRHRLTGEGHSGRTR